MADIAAKSDPVRHKPDSRPDADLSGRQLGGFRLLRRLGRGAMAEVYLADQASLRRQVAVKVADFGLARLLDDRAQVNLTQVGITMGTPLYMSPEQVEGRAIDPRSDIYSLGVTSFHMLSGETPFRGETALSVAIQHLKTP